MARSEVEHLHQVALFQWVTAQQEVFPDLRFLYAIPNGGHRIAVIAAKMKAEGVKRGVLDIHLPVARGGYIGLWIEMKIKPNHPSRDQLWWIDNLRLQGHRVEVCYDWQDACEILTNYISQERTVYVNQDH